MEVSAEVGAADIRPALGLSSTRPSFLLPSVLVAPRPAAPPGVGAMAGAGLVEDPLKPLGLVEDPLEPLDPEVGVVQA